jgi:hypothetical protein
MENDSIDAAICNYDTGRAADPVVSILIRCCPCGATDPTSILRAYGGAGMTVTSVGGVGNAAYWVATSSDAGGFVIDQLVVFGTNVQLVVTISAGLEASFMFDPLAAAEGLARDALSRL